MQDTLMEIIIIEDKQLSVIQVGDHEGSID
jgi:hypothetical protein